MSDLRNERSKLRKAEYDEFLEDTKGLIGKCFVCCEQVGIFALNHYVMITGYPKLETSRVSTDFNRYQFPSIQFYLGSTYYPCSIEDDLRTEDVFFYGTFFTGDLPPEYRYGAKHLTEKKYVEIPAKEFNGMMSRRFAEFRKKISDIQG